MIRERDAGDCGDMKPRQQVGCKSNESLEKFARWEEYINYRSVPLKWPAVYSHTLAQYALFLHLIFRLAFSAT